MSNRIDEIRKRWERWNRDTQTNFAYGDIPYLLGEIELYKRALKLACAQIGTRYVSKTIAEDTADMLDRASKEIEKEKQ